MEIADSLSEKQRKLFLELTEKVNLLDSSSYSHLDLAKYENLLNTINELYDGKVDYIANILKVIEKHKKLGCKTEELINEFVKS